MPGDKVEMVALVEFVDVPDGGASGEVVTAYSKLLTPAGASHAKFTEVLV